ncbi:MAG: SynChlorMet cassette protein ScmC [Candidatus Eremiobacterota bacterium]
MTLYLNEKLNWNFIGNSDLLNKLSKAMSLADLKSPNKIFLFKKKDDIHEIPKKYFDFKLGWNLQDNLSSRYLTHEILKDIIISLKPENDYMGFKNMFFPVWHQVIKEGGLPLHCALLEKNGKGLLFIAPNSGGKSTISNLASSPWEVRSDDMNIIIDRKAFPLPTWSYFTHKSHLSSRRTWDTLRPSPVMEVFFLEKSKEDRVGGMTNGEAVMRIVSSVTEINEQDFKYMDLVRLRTLRRLIFDNAWNLAKITPCHILKFNKEGNPWEKIEEVMQNV